MEKNQKRDKYEDVFFTFFLGLNLSLMVIAHYLNKLMKVEIR
jgi:hypothetical protein